MDNFWKLFGAFILFIVFQPLALWLIATLHVAGGGLATSAALASIMGATFTAGGLVVAIVALYTLVNAQNIVKDSVQKALVDVHKEVNLRISTFLEAYTPFRQAQDLWGASSFRAIDAIATLLAKADEIAPALPDLRRWGGNVFFQAARASFLQEHVADSTYHLGLNPLLRPSLAMKSITRLKGEFYEQGASNKRELAIRIAQLQALLGDQPAVLRWLDRAKAYGELPPIDSVTAITLLAAAISTEDVKRVLARWNLTVMTVETLEDTLQSFGQPSQAFVAFLRKTGDAQNPPPNPTTLTFKSNDGWKSCHAQWTAKVVPIAGFSHGGIPPFGPYDAERGVCDPPLDADASTVLTDVLERFAIIMPYGFERITFTP